MQIYIKMTDLKEKISILPLESGVYRFLDSSGTIIYIGKAKSLRKRVQQYFVSPDRLTTKTRVLVSKIADIQHTVVESEQDALLLENNLIKQYQPKYNILLKDGKSYPWLCIKNEPFPRIFLTRPLLQCHRAREVQAVSEHTYKKMLRPLHRRDNRTGIQRADIQYKEDTAGPHR